MIKVKKEYVKPQAVIQDMSVNSFMAGLCSSMGGTAINYSEDTCSITDPDSFMTYFSDNCETDDGWGVDIVNPNVHSPYAQLCYHRPMDALTFFSS